MVPQKLYVEGCDSELSSKLKGAVADVSFLHSGPKFIQLITDKCDRETTLVQKKNPFS